MFSLLFLFSIHFLSFLFFPTLSFALLLWLFASLSFYRSLAAFFQVEYKRTDEDGRARDTNNTASAYANSTANAEANVGAHACKVTFSAASESAPFASSSPAIHQEETSVSLKATTTTTTKKTTTTTLDEESFDINATTNSRKKSIWKTKIQALMRNGKLSRVSNKRRRLTKQDQ